MPAMQDTAVHLSDRHFQTIAELIEDQVGIKLPPGKRLMLEGRLRKRVRALNFADLTSIATTCSRPTHFDAELTHLIDAVTTNKTDFFREPEHFAFLRGGRCRRCSSRTAAERDAEVWSAACSTGAEAYTLAMVLDD